MPSARLDALGWKLSRKAESRIFTSESQRIQIALKCSFFVKPIFGTRGSELQILSPRPFFSFGPIKDHIEGLSICRVKTYRIHRAVRKHHSQQSRLFCWFPCNVQKIRLVREFENTSSGQHPITV